MSASETIEPPIRFPEFKEPWETKPIERILERHSTAVDVEPETLYTQIGLRSHGKGVFHKKPVTGESLGNKRVFWIHPNCLVVNIVFAWEQAVGKTTEQEAGLIASHRFPMYTPKDKQADIDFIVRFFLRPRGKHLLGLASPGGAGRNRTLGQKEFDKLKIVVPSLPEQRKIADFLTAVDGRIGQLVQKKAWLTDYKKGVMQQLFTQAIRFKDDHGNDFPDWEEKKLKAVAKIYDGTHTTPSYTETGVPFYSVEHLTRGCFQKTRFISEEVFEKENKRVKLERGDVLMTRIGDIGTSRHLDWDVRASFYVSLALIKLQRDHVSPQFAHHSISARYFQQELWQRTIHVAFPKKINLGEIGECQIKLPTMDEQTKIADFLSAIDRKIESVATQITETQTFKRGLLQQMFV